MASASLKITIVLNAEVMIMITAIVMMHLAVGTALLGRSVDMFPMPGEMACIVEMNAFETWEGAHGGSIPPRPTL
jgi:hypothetical protein